MRAAARRGRSRRNVADVPTYTNRAGGNRTLTPLARPQILSLLRLPTPPRPHTAVVAQAWRPETVARTGRIGYFPLPTIPGRSGEGNGVRPRFRSQSGFRRRPVPALAGQSAGR